MAKGKYQKWLENDKLILLQGWARDGLTDEQIARNIGIGKTALYDWKNKYTEFADALKKGKEVIDYEVENALLKKALDGDVTAMIFWLKNRRPDKWRDKPQETKDIELIENSIHTLADIINKPIDDRDIKDYEE